MKDQDHPKVLMPPPVFFLIHLVIGFSINYLLPLQIVADGGRLKSGFIFMGLSLILFVWSVATFKKFRNDPNPYVEDKLVITSGPYRFTRNPIYMAMIIFVVGTGILFNNWWIVLLVVPSLIILSEKIVKKEEEYLTEKFGEEYREYRRKVRRWL